MMKKLLYVLFVIGLIAFGLVWYFVTFRLDGVIKNQIEQAGAQSFGTRVTVGKVETDIKDGSLAISNISVANPPGYSNPNAFSLDRIEAAVDYGSREIRHVVIEQPHIVIEEMGGQTNFGQMLQELESDEPAGEAASGEQPVITIRHFRLNQSQAAFESQSFDRYSDVEVDAIELNDIRGTPEEVAKVIARAVVSDIASQAAIELLKAQANKQLQDVGDKVSGKLKDLLGSDDPEED